MFNHLKNKIKRFSDLNMNMGINSGENVDIHSIYTIPIDKNLEHNIENIQNDFKDCSDLIIRRINVHGTNMAVISFAGFYDKEVISLSVINPLLNADCKNKKLTTDFIEKNVLSIAETINTPYIDQIKTLIMSGFSALLIDGESSGLLLALQAFAYRSISESDNEVVLRGPREGFIEVLQMNMTLVRRRIKDSSLKLEMMQIGRKSRTFICIAYLSGVADMKTVKEVKKRLKNIRLDFIFESGYIEPYLEDNLFSIFPTVGITERPDTLCGKISEGRIGIMVDGTPSAIYVPYLFPEVFENSEDYYQRSIFGTMLRWIRIAALFISLYLPALYVALATFHQESLPPPILNLIITSSANTPFSLVFEALLMHIIYEIIREAGIRLPRPVGQAMGIVGALVIGESAVSVGLMGVPMVIIVALTAICSFVVTDIYEAVLFMRFMFIIAAGICGLYGIMILTALMLTSLCSLTSFNIPYLSPFAPFDLKSQRDMLVRVPWPFLKKTRNISNLAGARNEKDNK